MAASQIRGFAFLCLVFYGQLFLPPLIGQQPVPEPQPGVAIQTPVPTVEVPGTAPAPPGPDRPSQEAIPTREVPSPATPSNPQDAIAWGLGASYVAEWLKKKKWFSFITEESSQQQKTIFGFVMAFLTAAGIQFVVSGSVFDAGGASVTFTGITFTGIKDVLFQWIAQQGWYDLLVHQRSSTAVARREHVTDEV